MMKKVLFGLMLAVLMVGCREAKVSNSGLVPTLREEVPEKLEPGTENVESVTEEVETFTENVKPSTKKVKPATAAVATPDLLKQRVARGPPEKLLTRKGYVTSYNKTTRTPNWVAWMLTKEHTYGKMQRDEQRFEEDPDVPTPRATFQDYYNSRYDRGHMCPAGDNKWDQEAMTESFLMTNICPQNHGLNKEDWNELEIQCRTWARRFGELTIVCGPLFEDEHPRQIGRNKVTVPSAFFKVVCRQKPEPHAIGFIFRNDGSPQPWRGQAVSVDEVERRAGIDFFFDLPDDVEDAVESEEGLEHWRTVK